jgi:hypothetical protein
MNKIPDTIEMIPILPMIGDFAKGKKVAIDVGVCKATGSTRYITRAMAEDKSTDKVFIGIDHLDQREDFFELEPWQHYVMGDSREQSTIEKCKKILGDRKADLIFIDTVHEYDFLKTELNLWKQLANENTIWLFHDTWMFGFYNHMTDAIKEFAQESGIWEFVNLTKEAHGLGLLKPIKK